MHQLWLGFLDFITINDTAFLILTVTLYRRILLELEFYSIIS